MHIYLGPGNPKLKSSVLDMVYYDRQWMSKMEYDSTV